MSNSLICGYCRLRCYWVNSDYPTYTSKWLIRSHMFVFTNNEFIENVVFWLLVWWESCWVAWSCSLETAWNVDEVCSVCLLFEQLALPNKAMFLAHLIEWVCYMLSHCDWRSKEHSCLLLLTQAVFTDKIAGHTVLRLVKGSTGSWLQVPSETFSSEIGFPWRVVSLMGQV